MDGGPVLRIQNSLSFQEIIEASDEKFERRTIFLEIGIKNAYRI